MNPKVSIIIPIYNSEKTIFQCLSSVLEQSYSNIEVICVNDGSRDGSQDILEKAAKADSRIKVITQENSGVSVARNTGLENATGEYVQFVDSDDVVMPELTEKLIKTMEQNHSDLVICGIMSSNNKIHISMADGSYSFMEIKSHFSEMYRATYLNSPCNKLYKRSQIEGIRFDKNISLGEDLIFNLEYMQRCDRISILSDMLYVYILSDDLSLTTKYYANGFEMAQTVIEQIEKFLGPDFYEIQRDALCADFSLDFQRCLDNEMLKSGKKIFAICRDMRKELKSSFWKEHTSYENCRLKFKLLAKGIVLPVVLITIFRHGRRR